MGFIIGLLTFILVVDCAALVLLVLVQLPKKEAGAGLAFGGAASDALFGAGSGTVLTKITKYAAGAFFILAIVLGMLQSRFQSRTSSGFERRLSEPPRAAAPAATPSTPAAAPAQNPGMTLSSTGMLSTTPEAPAAGTPTATNAAPQK
jgi:preprotein translocase subunit SecG